MIENKVPPDAATYSNIFSACFLGRETLEEIKTKTTVIAGTTEWEANIDYALGIVFYEINMPRKAKMKLSSALEKATHPKRKEHITQMLENLKKKGRDYLEY
jgi:hypothetical protein